MTRQSHDQRSSIRLGRRQILTAGAALGAAATGIAPELQAKKKKSVDDFVAKAPAGFKPWSKRGRVVQVTKGTSFQDLMQPNELWPKPDVAKKMLERAMTKLTGASNLEAAIGRVISKDDTVAIKVNGIAGQNGYTMAVNFELVLPVVEAIIKVGVPVNKITVYEQWPKFLKGSRINVKNWKLPAGVLTATHRNRDYNMPRTRIFKNKKTAYCKTFTDATAVIDMTMIKDHSISGYTGCLKNITHGNIYNPSDHHQRGGSPQIATLYNHPVVTSRVRLHIVDAFKIMYDKGPLDNARTRIPHGAIYVGTDPVALDTIGWRLVEEERKKRGLKPLKDVRREPAYIKAADKLGLGRHDINRIRFKKVTA